MTRNVKKAFLLIIGCALIFVLQLNSTSASEITGSLCTGLNCPVEGTVVSAPTASPAAGTYTSTQSVTLSASGATSIRYTLDGTSPICSSSQYSTALSVTTSKTVKALACYPNSVTSTIASFAYTLQCATPTVTNGSVSAYPTCAITCNSGYTLSGSSCSSSGGGGGGGGGYFANPTPANIPETTTSSLSSTTTGSVQNKLNTLITQLQVLQSKASAQQGAAPLAVAGGRASFIRNMQVNSRGEDVRQLQIFLNDNGFPVAAGGAGSPGKETNLFGNATRAALVKYQASVGLPATGYLGLLTRAKIAENVASSVPSSVPIPPPIATQNITFSRSLGVGSKGTDITSLQSILKNEGLLNVSTTGYFGALTENAVKAFQEKYNIAKRGDSGYGFVGPKTRAKLNGLIQ